MGKVKPNWLKYTIPGGSEFVEIKKIISSLGLNTVCCEAKCPNVGDCFGRKTAAFLILGDVCTRNCLYCAVKTGTPTLPNVNEPSNIAQAVFKLKLNYAVITSVTRDDLPDGGASHFCETVKQIRNVSPETKIELLIPDFAKSVNTSLDKIIAVQPNVINHNIEAVKRLFNVLRPNGNYELSLKILSQIAEKGLTAKSGLMIGFGEDMDDILYTLKDLLNAGCSFVTIGQYLQSSKNGYVPQKYYTPDEFKEIREQALAMGFKNVKADPLVRSSFHAGSEHT